MKRHIITAAGVQTHYWTLGDPSQPAIVLLHGIKGTHLGLLPLAKRLRGHYVILPDMPSHGESGNLATTHTYEAMATWLSEFIKTLNLESPVIGGHSLGGMIAAVAIGKDNDLASRLILIVPVAAEDGSLVRILEDVFYGVDHLPERWQKFLLANGLFRYLICRINLVTQDKRVWKKQYATEKLEASMYRPKAIQELHHDFTRHDFFRIAKHIHIPTLVVAAQHDALTTPESQKRFAATLPKGKFELIEKAGHFVQIEQAPRLARLIKVFVGDETK